VLSYYRLWLAEVNNMCGSWLVVFAKKPCLWPHLALSASWRTSLVRAGLPWMAARVFACLVTTDSGAHRR